jgi:hypothetical protein
MRTEVGVASAPSWPSSTSSPSIRRGRQGRGDENY